MTPSEALRAAVDQLGGQAGLARALGGKVRQAHVFYWLKTGKLPSKYVLMVERACKHKVRRYQLRPDVYPQPRRSPRPTR
jgi:DNA-binding transcriptional regulator YdaS (Cro superfamily)